MRRSLVDFIHEVRSHAAEGRLGLALQLISELMLHVMSRDSSMARVFSSPELDQLCLELGREFVPAPAAGPEAWDEDQPVFLVTSLYQSGGHTRVLRDFIVADGGKHPIVLATNAAQQVDPASIQGMVDCRLEIAEGEDWGQKLIWLQQRLAAIKPSRVYIIPHPFDPILVAAVQPNLVNRLFYYHNCDHMIALGLHIPHAEHIDFNAKSYFHCRHDLHLNNNRIWPLTAAPPKGAPKTEFLVEGGLRTCCCGGMEKFELPHLREPITYSISYPDMVVRRLQSVPGAHVHIGYLSDNMRGRISEAMMEASIDPSRFEYHVFVPSLAEALHDLDIDLYMGSMPRGGGRATVEAMAAGAPLLIHSNYRSVFFTDINELYPSAMTWSTLDDLDERLTSVTSEKLLEYSVESRRHYDTHHRPEILSAAIKATLSGEPFVGPEAWPVFEGNPLQTYLDEREAENEVREGLVAAATASLHVELSGQADRLRATVAEIEKVGAQLREKNGEISLVQAELAEARAEAELCQGSLSALQGALAQSALELQAQHDHLADALNYPSKSAFHLTAHLNVKELFQLLLARLHAGVRPARR